MEKKEAEEIGAILASEIAPIEARMEKLETLMAAEFQALED